MTYFEQSIHKEFPSFSGELLQALQDKPLLSILLNPYKKVHEFAFEINEQVPWNPYGYYISGERPAFIEDPLWHAGAYYVQEPSSMAIYHIIKQLRLESSPLKVLDLCAAPGGKTLSIAKALPQNTFILANEVDGQRANILYQNIAKSGLPNLYVTNNHPKDFPEYPFFDIILVDAPCSGEGMIRKIPNLLHQITPQVQQACASRQQQILDSAHKLLKPGGFLIYATCTFNKQENELVIYDFLKNNRQFKTFEVSFSKEWNIYLSEYHEVLFYRFFPHFLRGEGLSLTVLKKTEEVNEIIEHRKAGNPHKFVPYKPIKINACHEWLIHPEEYTFFQLSNQKIIACNFEHFLDLQSLNARLNFFKRGIALATLHSKSLAPEHELALSTELHPGAFPCIEAQRQEALNFLKKQTFPLSAPQKGFYTLNYAGLPIGFINHLAHRWNNLLPKSWRILKNIEE